MKVLERKAWKWVFKCSACGSKLEAEANDVRVGYFNGNYIELGDKEYYVACPECDEAMIVPDSKLNGAVVSMADKKEG